MIIYILCALFVIVTALLLAFIAYCDKQLQRFEKELIYLNIKVNILRRNIDTDNIKFDFTDDLWR